MRTVAVVPAFNEAAVLGETIEGLREIDGLDQLWVVDDGSTDATARVARECGVEVTRLPANRGKGQALTHGFYAIPADVYLMVDADLGSQVKNLQPLLDPVAHGRADMTVGIFRRPREQAGLGGFGLGMSIARLGIRWLTGFSAREPLSGQRVLNRRVVEAVCPLTPAWPEVALTIDALRAGLTVLEVETSLVHMGTGRTLQGFLHRGQQLIHILKALAGRVRHRWAQ